MKAQIIEKEGRFYKECGVVMLESTKESPISLEKDGGMRLKFIGIINNGYFNTSTQQNQHLYITSDDEIKEGDWIYHPLDVKPIQFYSTVDLIDPSSYGYKKIIATTDTSLTILHKSEYHSGYCEHLPQPSDKFIKSYIEAYNKGEKIEKIAVYGKYESSNHWKYSLKNNIIIIKKVKDSWSKEEVIKVAFDAFYQGFADSESGLYCAADIKRNFDKWINENL